MDPQELWRERGSAVLVSCSLLYRYHAAEWGTLCGPTLGVEARARLVSGWTVKCLPQEGFLAIPGSDSLQ